MAWVEKLEAADNLRAGLVALLMTCAADSRDADGVALSLEVAAEAARDESVDEVYRQFTAMVKGLLSIRE